MKTRILRIYMRTAAKVKGELSFWKRIFQNDLSWYLVKKAKESGIEQAIAQRATAGYLKGKKIAVDGVEVIPPDLPVCVELVDSEEKLRSFISSVKNQLEECRVVLFEGAVLSESRS